MFMAVKNETWIILFIVIVAGGLIALSFSSNKPQPPLTVADEVIKPDHTAEDMQQMAATRHVSAMVEEPKASIVKAAFAIQVFSFKDKERADVSLKQLKDKGFPAYVMMSDLGARGIFYRVRVGSFATEGEAEKALVNVVKDFKSGIIVSE
jgi:cell division septation protein DedD